VDVKNDILLNVGMAKISEVYSGVVVDFRLVISRLSGIFVCDAKDVGCRRSINYQGSYEFGVLVTWHRS